MWIGANNWNPAGGASNAYYSSSLALATPPITVGDENDAMTQNCVTLEGSLTNFTDYNCECSYFNFICERRVNIEPEPCTDLTQEEVDLEEWCEVGYQQDECTEDCINEDCECQEMQKDLVLYANENTMKLIQPKDECRNWPEAQIYCCKTYGGRLWEPQSAAEYNAVMADYIKAVRICFISTYIPIYICAI